MKRTVALLGAALLAASFAPKAANAAPRCEGVHQQSIFGTVIDVRNGEFTVHQDPPAGDVNVYMPDNDIRNVGGASLRRGVYAGVFGCFPAGSRQFISEEITLSPSAATYPAEYRYATERVIYGRVDRVEQGRILVHGTARRDTWVATDKMGFSTGETVKVIGHLDPNGVFVARRITVEQ